MGTRSVAVVFGLALLVAACSPSPESASVTTDTRPPTTAITPPPSTSVVTTTVPVPAKPGEWIETVFDEDQFIFDFVESDDGNLLALLGDRDGRYRIIQLGEGGVWNPVTEWTPSPTSGFNFVSWLGLADFGAAYVVAGYGQLPPGANGQVLSVPAFARVDKASGATSVILDPSSPDLGVAIDVAQLRQVMIAVGEAPNAGDSWGPGIWVSEDADTWESVETPDEVESVVYHLATIAASDTTVVAVGVNNYDEDPPYALWSSDAIDWHAVRLPGVNEGESVRADAVIFDGSEFVIAGERKHDPQAMVWRSSDGMTWALDESDPAAFGTGEVNLIGLWGGHGGVLASGDGVHRQSALYCVDDPTTCREEFDALWLGRGGAWTRLIPPTPSNRAYRVALAGDRIVTAGRVGESGAVWVWVPGADGDLPIAELFDTSPPLAALPQLGRDPYIEEGTAYLYPMSSDCSGMEQLGYVNGVFWLIAGDRVLVSPDWPVATAPGEYGDDVLTVFGTIELTAADRIEYAVEGFGVVATYEPAPADYEPYGCM